MVSRGQSAYFADAKLHLSDFLISNNGNALAGAMINVIFAYTGWNNGKCGALYNTTVCLHLYSE